MNLVPVNKVPCSSRWRPNDRTGPVSNIVLNVLRYRGRQPKAGHEGSTKNAMSCKASAMTAVP